MARRPTDYAAERERFVEDLLAIMSVEEKVGQLALERAPDPADTDAIDRVRDQLRRGQLSGLVGPGSPAEFATLQSMAIEETRLGIPLLYAATPGRGEAVIMPSPFALAASWAPEVVERAARIVAAEARDRGKNSHTDKDLSASWGASGLLARCLASATVRGLQFEDQEGGSMLACLRVDNPSWTGRRGAHLPADQLRLVAGVLRESPPASIALGRIASSLDNGDQSTSATFAIGGPGGFEGIDLAEWTEIAKAAGQDLTGAPYADISVAAVVAAVADGRVTPLQLDDAVRKVLGAKYDLGLFRSAGPEETETPKRSAAGARTVALDAARHAIILLRNDPALLPLSIDSGEILVVGQAAGDRSLPTGGLPQEGASLIDGFDTRELAHNFVPGLALRRDQAGSSSGDLIDADHMAIGMASEAARRAGTVIVTLGETSTLTAAQQTLLEALYAVNRSIVLITLGARPLDPDISGAKLPCIIHAGQLGSMSGHAITDVLTGEFAPCGRLPIPLVDRGRVGLTFGHGLNYSEFGLGQTTTELGHDRLVVSTVLHNVGGHEGTETVQLYLRRPGGRGQERTELADFQRVLLGGGETRQILFEVGGSEDRAHAIEIAVPQAVADAMGKARASEPLPALFGKLRSVG
jgi:beta-glucosidase